MEYLVKGAAGLPMCEQDDDNSDTNNEYEDHVLKNYAEKNWSKLCAKKGNQRKARHGSKAPQEQ